MTNKTGLNFSACLLAGWSLLYCTVLPRAASAQGQAGSTAAPVSVQSPLMLSFSKNSYSSRVSLDYSLRWDFSDLASFRPGLGIVYSGIKAISNWDLMENTRLDYYGLKTNPWRLIITKERKSAAIPPPGAGGLVRAGNTVYRKRLRFSISPLVDDFKRNFDENLRDFLLRNSLKGLSPEWEKAGEAGRRSFVRDVLSLGVWGVPLPGVKETRAGLEYISGEGGTGSGGKLKSGTEGGKKPFSYP